MVLTPYVQAVQNAAIVVFPPQIVIDYYTFYILEDHNAAWDIKRKDSWERTIGTSYPGDGAQVYYHNRKMNLEAL